MTDLEKIDKRLKAVYSVYNDIKDNSYSVLSKKEFHFLISSINNIYGLRSLNNKFIQEFLVRNNLILPVKQLDDIYSFPDRKYDIFDLVSINSRSSFFSHYSAVYIHNLTEQIPKNIYLSYERPNRADKKYTSLKQESIDVAFSKSPRVSSNFKKIDHYNVYYLNSQAYNKIGIEKFKKKYLVTDIERTLIDITIKPFYSGGVTQVLEAYNNSKEYLDVNKLLDYYIKMDFIYPYHQLIGFYLQRCNIDGYELFKNFNMSLKFYLTYNILHSEYSEEWNIIYPKGL